jgi:hypothetical protein
MSLSEGTVRAPTMGRIQPRSAVVRNARPPPRRATCEASFQPGTSIVIEFTNMVLGVQLETELADEVELGLQVIDVLLLVVD